MLKKMPYVASPVNASPAGNHMSLDTANIPANNPTKATIYACFPPKNSAFNTSAPAAPDGYGRSSSSMKALLTGIDSNTPNVPPAIHTSAKTHHEGISMANPSVLCKYRIPGMVKTTPDANNPPIVPPA